MTLHLAYFLFFIALIFLSGKCTGSALLVLAANQRYKDRSSTWVINLVFALISAAGAFYAFTLTFPGGI